MDKILMRHLELVSEAVAKYGQWAGLRYCAKQGVPIEAALLVHAGRWPNR